MPFLEELLRTRLIKKNESDTYDLMVESSGLIRIDVNKVVYPFRIYHKDDPRRMEMLKEHARDIALTKSLAPEFEKYGLSLAAADVNNSVIKVVASGLEQLAESELKDIFARLHPLYESLVNLKSGKVLDELQKLLKNGRHFFIITQDPKTGLFKYSMPLYLDVDVINMFLDTFLQALRHIAPEIEQNHSFTEQQYYSLLAATLDRTKSTTDLDELKSLLTMKLTELKNVDQRVATQELTTYFNKITNEVSMLDCANLFDYLMTYRPGHSLYAGAQWKRGLSNLPVNWEVLIENLRGNALKKVKEINSAMGYRQAIEYLKQCRGYSIFNLPNTFKEKLGFNSPAITEIDQMKKLREEEQSSRLVSNSLGK